MSGIHRYMKNKLPWLRKVTGVPEATVISRARLPRMLAGLDWVALNVIINDCFSEKIRLAIENGWQWMEKCCGGRLKWAKNKRSFMQFPMTADLT
jgi:hypothetical protein